jgi:hypothetical protein
VVAGGAAVVWCRWGGLTLPSAKGLLEVGVGEGVLRVCVALAEEAHSWGVEVAMVSTCLPPHRR